MAMVQGTVMVLDMDTVPITTAASAIPIMGSVEAIPSPDTEA